jgi:hypothetical protein
VHDTACTVTVQFIVLSALGLADFRNSSLHVIRTAIGLHALLGYPPLLHRVLQGTETGRPVYRCLSISIRYHEVGTMPCWGKKIAQRIASWTWDVTHERALSPADLFGGKAPVGALIGLLERIR